VGLMPSFLLSLDDMLRYTIGYKFSGVLKADIAAIPKFPGRGYVTTLTLTDGVISKCEITSQDRTFHMDAAVAMSVLKELGVLSWELLPSEETLSYNQEHSFPRPSHDSVFIHSERPHDLLSLPRNLRRVYQCIDGTKTILALARLLAIPEKQVYDSVLDLQKRGLVQERDRA